MLHELFARYWVLMATAFGAGAINSMAGGGSFFTFPTLMGLGLPPVNANATNTVALWPGSALAIVAFRGEVRVLRKVLLGSVTMSAIGGVAGALALLFTDQSTFLKLVPWLLLFATVLFAVSAPVQKWLRRHQPVRPIIAPEDQTFPLSLYLSLAVVCVYIGYFGAGAGFLVITLFSLFGIGSMNHVNAMKVVCTTVANGVAVATFVFAGAVYWKECILMMVVASIGGYFGAHYSRKLDPRILRGVVIATGLALSIYYFQK